MTTYRQVVERRLLAAYNDPKQSGIVVVTRLKRASLIAWALSEFEKQCKKETFRSLFVATNPASVRQVYNCLRAPDMGYTGNDYQLLRREGAPLPNLRKFNFSRLGVVRTLIGQFQRESLDVIILEQQGPGEMDELAGRLTHLNPQLAVIWATREGALDNTWEHYGPPLTGSKHTRS